MSKIHETRKAKKTLRDFAIFLGILLVVSFLYGNVFYNGFFFGVPSSATYLNNYSNLGSISWDTFVANHTQLDPKTAQSSSPTDVWIKVSDTSWTESATRPHNYFSFHISFGTNFEVDPTYSQPYSKATLTQPSLLILVLDQNNRIREKIYTVQGSTDFFMKGNNGTDATFWFKIPSDMQNQPITIIVELWGIVNSNSYFGNNYINSGNYNHPAYTDSYDDIYGSIPSPPLQYLQQGYVNLNFLATGNLSTHTPDTSPPIWEMVGYATFFAFLLTVLSSLVVLVRNKTGEWWNKNKFYVIFGFAFLITYIVILVIVGMLL